MNVWIVLGHFMEDSEIESVWATEERANDRLVELDRLQDEQRDRRRRLGEPRVHWWIQEAEVNS